MPDGRWEACEAGEMERPLLPTDSSEGAALLQPSPRGGTFSAAGTLNEVGLQARTAAPVAASQVANFLLPVISLAVVGQLGTRALAAASVATVLFAMSAKVVLAGMLAALDSHASQAVGARRFDQLGAMFKQAVSCLLVHTIPMSALLMPLPALLRWLGQPEGVTVLVGPYLLALLPNMWIKAIYRPLNHILAAQQVVQPQAWISCLVAAQHVPAAWAAVRLVGYLGGAYAAVWSALLSTLLLAGYVRWAGLHGRVWDSPAGTPWAPWPPYLRACYAACAHRVAASWSVCLCTIAAGWLPSPQLALAAVGVATAVYGTTAAGYHALVAAVCARVGDALAANSPRAAQLSALVALASVPALWAAPAAALLLPWPQAALISAFAAPDAEPELPLHLRNLARILAALLLFDIPQAVLSGVAKGAGKRGSCFAINCAAQWAVGLPVALALGFYAGLGVEGLYAGLVAGPLTQLACHAWLVGRMDWAGEARRAHARALAVTDSVSGAGI